MRKQVKVLKTKWGENFYPILLILGYPAFMATYVSFDIIRRIAIQYDLMDKKHVSFEVLVNWTFPLFWLAHWFLIVLILGRKPRR